MKPEYIVAGRKIYLVCEKCGSLVQVNKLLFGSLHICITDEEDKTRKYKEDV